MIFASKRRLDNRPKKKSRCNFCEPLEARTLLSATNVTVHPGIVVSPANVPASEIQGDTPAQISKAYGFDQVSFGDGSVAADGQGQTIAIVDPYNDPPVKSDLNVFDNQFGIAAPPSFTVVNQTGGARLPATNGSWAGEIATDVEWSHAIAPAANLLLVEANTDNTDDLMSAVDFARHYAGVSVISISWGGSEFPGQTAYDDEFETPANHIPITVVVAGGDNGAAGGAQWPGTSPNVLSVGGTVLALQDQSGTYGGETSWSDSSGGYSQFETEPSWQEVVQRTGERSMPDVSYDADANIGLALYDSVPFEGIVGWQITDGTSVGTPQWAALVAIADQGRVLDGQATLDGPSQTMPALYDLYGAPGTTAYAAYTADFNDIITPENPSATTGQPNIGYDTTSGLGSPKAVPIIDALVSAGSAASLMTTTQPLASPVTIAITKQPPAAVVGASAGALTLRLTDASTQGFSGPVSIALYNSAPDDLASQSTPIVTMTLPHLILRTGGSKTEKLTFAYPTVSTAGAYYLIGSVSTSQANTAPAEVITTGTVTISPPFVELSPTFTGGATVLVNPGKNSNASVLIKNIGNLPAVGSLSLDLYDSIDQTLDTSTDLLLDTTPTRTIKLQPGGSILLHLKFLTPSDQSAGGYYLIASITSTVGGTSNIAVIGTRGKAL